jgi:hypothetical protein
MTASSLESSADGCRFHFDRRGEQREIMAEGDCTQDQQYQSPGREEQPACVEKISFIEMQNIAPLPPA